MGYLEISLTLSQSSIFKLHFLENLGETLFYIFDLNCFFFQVDLADRTVAAETTCTVKRSYVI